MFTREGGNALVTPMCMFVLGGTGDGMPLTDARRRASSLGNLADLHIFIQRSCRMHPHGAI